MTETKKEFFVDRVHHGYNHDILYGHYTGDVTVKDVEDQFYHFYFGGRGAAIDEKKKTFSVTVNGCD